MKIAIIGRSNMLFQVMKRLHEVGHEINLVITSKEAPEYKITHTDFENFASEIGAQFIYTPKINESEIIDQIEKLDQMDLAVSINYTGVIGQNVIDLFQIGILNMHAGDLPKYRGNAVVAWAMLNQEKEIVNCIHKMIGGELDSGDIIVKNNLPLTINTKIQEVFDWLETSAPDLFESALMKLAENPEFVLEKQSKKPQDALRCYPRKPEDARINWCDSNEDILRLINASSEPFSGAFSYFENEILRIWRAELLEDGENWLGIPGQITAIGQDEIVVLTGNGKLKITEVEYKDQRMTPSKIFKSLRSRLN